MQNKSKGFEKAARELIREERLAFMRVKDAVRKYRLMLPFLSGNADRLETKIARLMSNNEESENSLKKINARIAAARNEAWRLEKKLHGLDRSRRELIARYNMTLLGKPYSGQPSVSATSTITELKESREKFLMIMTGDFKKLEEDISKLDRQQEALTLKKEELQRQIVKNGERARIIDRTISLYQADIRKRLQELNSQVQNEKRLTAEYSALIEKLKETPNLSSWPASMVMEAIRHSQPKTRILELQKPMRGAAPQTTWQ